MPNATAYTISNYLCCTSFNQLSYLASSSKYTCSVTCVSRHSTYLREEIAAWPRLVGNRYLKHRRGVVSPTPDPTLKQQA